MPSDVLAITGCNGSVGVRVTLRALKQGYTVRGIDVASPRKPSPDTEWIHGHPKFEFVKADLTEYSRMYQTLERCNALVHLAAIPSPLNADAGLHNINVNISWNALRACSELGINHIALASSVNATGGVYNKVRRFDYLPLDEDHPCRPDEAYGLSKQILEMQADAMVLRFPSMRIASLRLSWSLPDTSLCTHPERASDMWGYVQEDAAAAAFLLALDQSNTRWSGHERFFIAAPYAVVPPGDATNFEELRKKWYPDVPAKEGRTDWKGFYNVSKAERLLGWVHDEAAKL